MSQGNTAVGVLGKVAVSVVKNVPTRAALWSLVGFFLSVVGVVLSFVLGLYFMGRGALILGYLAAIPIAIPFLAGSLMFVHGLQRGAARVALELEEKAGLVRYVVGQVVSELERRTGGPGGIPVEQIDRNLRGAVEGYLASADFKHGSGLGGWVIRRAKRSVAKRLDSYFLTALREPGVGGAAGSFSAARITEVVSDRLSEKLAEVVMSGLNTQLWILLAAVAVISSTWWFWLFLILAGITKL